MNAPIKLMLVEDSADFRKGIAYVLSEKPDIVITNEFGTAEIAIRTLEEMAKEDLPDIILLDLNLPGITGLDAIPEINKHAPESKIIILTQSDKEADVIRGINLGAAGYMLKKSSMSSLIEGIKTVHSGGATLDPSLAKFILSQLTGKLAEAPQELKLSNREMDVLTLIADGLARKQIADQLDLSLHTVDEYIHNIYTKLDVANAPAAVSKAYKTGIFSKDK
ncbi:DNA-binding response regulator [bacterium E08(2017)]|nr:DNA-binding response regulator [bacterium E08(2017)]